MAILITYGLALTFILCYSFVQIGLVVGYLRSKKHSRDTEPIPVADRSQLPMVTVQLPVYNEMYVIGRLIDHVAAFDYPLDKLEIQILDDSTDETTALIEQKVREWSNKGVDIVHLQRRERSGFKAGALAAGLEVCKGELVAIFDADFLPEKDFLLRTVGYFENKAIGVVQTKWEHINRDYSWLTKLQAFGLDAHFSVEQVGRNAGGHFINFNGTAGVWRKTCIEDAGGWQSDTLTEDLDLSYRAQLKGWKFKYLEGVGAPAELPAAMNALKTQQFRWTKGAAECARKTLWKVIIARDISFKSKLHAIFHLGNSAVFLSIMVLTILSVPVLFLKLGNEGLNNVFTYAGIFLLSLVFLAIFYFVSLSNRFENKGKALLYFLREFPLFLSISMGLSLHNAIAVLEGYMGKKTPFVRTPKFNIVGKSGQWQHNKYLMQDFSLTTLLEILLMLYAGIGIVYGIRHLEFGLLPFHILLFFGFGYVAFSSVIQSLFTKKKS